MPQVGGPIVAVGKVFSISGTILNIAVNLAEGNILKAATNTAGAILDKKASNAIEKVVTIQGMSEQSRNILEGNKEIFKEVTSKAIEEIKKQ